MEQPFINTYIKGLDKDTSPLKYAPEKYYHLENFKILTEGGSSSAALENEKGNRRDFKIPNTQGVYKIKEEYIGSVIVTLEGLFYSETFDSAGLTIEQFYNNIISNTNIANQLGDAFNISLNEGYILFFGLDQLNISVNDDTYLTTVVSPYTAESFHVVHMNYIDNYVIVFTTVNDGNGQIWFVPYNEETNLPENTNAGFLVPSLHLKYNNAINLDLDHAINKSIVRKETAKVCRIYWTDFYNPARKFNLLDPNGYAIEPSDLDFNADVTFSKPIVTSVDNGGYINYGSMVQFGYILVGNGNDTIVSPLSDIVPIYQADSQTDGFTSLEGNPYQLGTGKSVSYKIPDVDISYAQIKHVAIIYELNNVPFIKVFKTENILSSEILVTFTNNEEYETLTEQELNDVRSQFTVCKSLTSQNNRLIAVNTKSPNFEVPNTLFDARAYRYDSNGVAKVKDKLGNLLTVDSLFTVPEEHDAINPFNDPDDPDYAEYKYQSNGSTLGGEGAFVKYSFVTKTINVDSQPNYAGTSAPFATPVIRTTINEGEYQFTNQFNHFKSPFIHFLYAGYSRDEVYRFGIVFFSKKGKPSFVKWIADIKFPTIKERALETYFGNLFANQLGIRFEVTIPEELQEQISGYEIVRVQRDISNRTCLGGGLFDPLKHWGDSATDEVNHAWEAPYVNSGEYNLNVFSYISPNLLFLGDNYKNGDYLRLDSFTTSLDSSDTSSEYGHINPAPSSTSDVDFVKLRRKQNYTNINKLFVQGVAFTPVGATTEFSSAFPNLIGSSNFHYNNELPDGTGNGGPKYLFALNNGTQLNTYLAPDSNSIHYMTYCRKLQKQYGGNTYEERSNNTYISTSSYQNRNTSNTFNVFGGDTYCNYFCFEYTQFADGTGGTPTSKGIFFVCETPFNVDLRHGNSFNKNRETLGSDSYILEEYAINPVYFQENNTIQHFKAKPFNAVTEDEQPYAIWVSEKKQNGEQLDSWVAFKVNNQIEVDGDYGPINHVTTFKDRVYFYQNQAIGLIPIEQQAITTDQEGVEMILGTGAVISAGAYGYISTKIGVLQHDAVVQSEDFIYNFDMRTKKMWRFSPGSKEPLSDIKGMSSYFYNTLYSTALEDNDAKTALRPISIHGAYEPRFNRLLFTFNVDENSFTISYNEAINTFESFYSFLPTVYLSTGRKLFSVPRATINSRNKVYQHNLGPYGVFYDEDPVDSTITYLIGSPITKEFTNLEWYSQCFNNLNQDQENETFEFISVFNDHQSTGQIDLQTSQSRRRFRYWRHAIQRDINSPQSQARIRNPWIFVKLIKSNENNNRFIMHDLMTYYIK